jgi:hypothetical protein
MRVPADPDESPFSTVDLPTGGKSLHHLDDRAWTLFESIDALFARAAKYVMFTFVKDIRMLGHSLTDLARHVVLADPMAIYEAAAGIGLVYDNFSMQAQNLGDRFSDVRRTWSGDAFDVFDDYNTAVLGHMFGDNHNNTSQLLLDTSVYLTAMADGVLEMRNALADSVSKVVEKALEQVQHALELIEADERSLPEEAVSLAFTAGVETGLQAATEVFSDVLGAIDVGVTALNGALQFQGAVARAVGHADVGSYLGNVHKIPTTASLGEDPPDYSDYNQWQPKGSR